MVRVMCFGTFDKIHEGHKFYLRESRKLGDELIVIVALDRTVKNVKGKLPLLNQEDRLKHLTNSGLVDKAILGDQHDKLKPVIKERPDVIALGYDQRFFTENLKEKLNKRGLEVKIIRIKPFRPETYKSSILNKHN